MSECRFCGAPNTPVRQVPAHVPCSDCYCDKDECYEACAKLYGRVVTDPGPIVYGYIVPIPDTEGNEDDVDRGDIS